jgi:hypothetical protein
VPRPSRAPARPARAAAAAGASPGSPSGARRRRASPGLAGSVAGVGLAPAASARGLRRPARGRDQALAHRLWDHWPAASAAASGLRPAGARLQRQVERRSGPAPRRWLAGNALLCHPGFQREPLTLASLIGHAERPASRQGAPVLADGRGVAASREGLPFSGRARPRCSPRRADDGLQRPVHGADRILGFATRTRHGSRAGRESRSLSSDRLAARHRLAAQVGHGGARRALRGGRGVLAASPWRWTTRSCSVRSMPVSAERVAACRVEPLGRGRRSGCSSASKAPELRAGPAGLVDLGGQAAQHLLDRDCRSTWLAVFADVSPLTICVRLHAATRLSMRPAKASICWPTPLGPCSARVSMRCWSASIRSLEPARRPIRQILELDHQGLDTRGQSASDAPTTRLASSSFEASRPAARPARLISSRPFIAGSESILAGRAFSTWRDNGEHRARSRHAAVATGGRCA